MTEKEKVALIQTTLDEVERMMKGKAAPSASSILYALKKNEELYRDRTQMS